MVKENREGRIWAVLIPDITSDAYPGMFKGIDDFASQQGVHVIVCNTYNDEAKQNAHIEHLILENIEGLIIIPSIFQEHGNKVFIHLHNAKIPFVFCNRFIPNVAAPCVRSNNCYGTFMATTELIHQGYSRIAYIAGSRYATSLERYEGYRMALQENGMETKDEYAVFEGSNTFEDKGYDTTRMLLKKYPEIDSICCFSDMYAIGVYCAVMEAGRNIGKNFGITGYDDSKICEKLAVKITSVDYGNYEVGKRAAKYLEKMIRKELEDINQTTILTPKLIIRESSKKETGGSCYV